MAILSRWVVPTALVAFTARSAEVSCSNDAESGGSSCSSSLQTPIDFVAMADDLDALNRSTGNQLREIRRVPCTGDWYPPDEPVFLEGCCWASGSAFQKGSEVADCSNDEDFLPLDYLNISLQMLMQHCGTQEIERSRESHAYEDYVKSFLEEPIEVQNDIDAKLLDIFNITLTELNAILQKTYTFAEFGDQKRTFQVRKRPAHPLGYFHPLYHAQSRSMFSCPAVVANLREIDFSLPSFYRPTPWDYTEEGTRKKEWVRSGVSLTPASGFSLPTHLHKNVRSAKVALLLEGKKHWQLVSMTAGSYESLQPLEGYKRKANGFLKAPIDIADEYPVYVGTQTKGEVLVTPWMWAHLVYTLEDSLGVVYRVDE
mmetsp:Transcript_62117/g.131212  ORF Transcript_62117/g.131212 Transcript_62117/m.131212 type:complete len:371 (-) Transcript_62117:97-1209(-)